MINVTDHFYAAADPDGLLADQNESDNAVDEQDTDLFENAGHLTLEMELDENKIMLNKINRLLDSTLDEDLIEAYDLVTSALGSGRFDNLEAIKAKLEGAFDHIHELLEDKPDLRRQLNLAPDDPAPSASPATPQPVAAGPAPSFNQAVHTPEQEPAPAATQPQGPQMPQPNIIAPPAPAAPSPFSGGPGF